MDIKDMSNAQLQRHRICAERELKTIQSTIKQLKDEEEKRYDDGKLSDKSEEEN